MAGRVDLAARAALQAGRGRAPAEAVRWIGRAFALDAREAAANGAEHAPALLEAASAVLTAEAPTPRQVAQAREWLVWCATRSRASRSRR